MDKTNAFLMLQPGRPSRSSAVVAPKPVSLCIRCLGAFSVGDIHHCRLKDRAKNLKQHVPKSILKKASFEMNDSVSKCCQTYHKSSCLASNEFFQDSKMPRPLVSHEAIQRAKTKANLSQSQTLKFVSEIAKDVLIQPHLRDHLSLSNTQFLEVFSIDIVEGTNGCPTPIVYCCNLGALINFVLQQRKLAPSDVLVRLSIDEGRGFLKLSASFVKTTGQAEESSFFKSSGVKAMLILAITPMKETYDSVSSLLSRIDFQTMPRNLKFIFAQDLKCINIVLGLGPHSSTYPCFLCLWRKGS